MERKKIFIISGSAIVAIGVISVVAAVWSGGPQEARDPKQQTVESRKKYFASKEFGGLPNSEKVKYIKAVNPRELFRNNKDISDEEKKQLRKNARSTFTAMMKERLDKYSQLATQEEKNVYLDEVIDKMTAGRKERDKKRKALTEEDKKKRAERRAERGKRTRSMEKIKNRIETSDPKDRAQRTGFFMDLRKRMKERGITMGRRGRR
jgi:hypothetical protein